MARILSRTLIRAPKTLTLARKSLSPSLPSFLRPSRRAKSSGAETAELIEIDLGSEPESGSGAAEMEVEIHVGVKRLEDAIQAIIVRRSCPEWAAFVPGSSYWVPPMGKGAMGVFELVGRVSSSEPPLSEDETMSLTSFRGWPSSEYFLQGALPHPLKRSSRNFVAQSDDEE